MELGGKFWLGLIAAAIGVGLAAWLVLLLIGWAWYAWGFLGAFIFFGGIAILIGWLHDRRETNRRRALDEAYDA